MSGDRCELLCLDLVVAERARARLLDEASATAAARRGWALSDPTRLTVAAALVEVDELCVCDLSWIVGRSQNLVSHHVRALRDNGLVRSRREGKMVMYALTPEGDALLRAMLGTDSAASREPGRV